MWSALKLVPTTKSLPLAKITEVMFIFTLEVLNTPGTSLGFFNTCKAAKLRTRSHKCKSGEKQPADKMAIDTPLSDPSPPPLSTGKPSDSTPASNAGAGNEGDKGEVPPGPSSEVPGTQGMASDTPCTSVFPVQDTPPPDVPQGSNCGGKEDHRYSLGCLHS